jgi:hypothetical protein
MMDALPVGLADTPYATLDQNLMAKAFEYLHQVSQARRQSGRTQYPGLTHRKQWAREDVLLVK